MDDFSWKIISSGVLAELAPQYISMAISVPDTL